MDNKKIKDHKLRKKAEKLFQNQFNPVKNQTKNLDEVIYELRVHQIELEMQNEELKKDRIELEDSRRQYFELYDLAPVGYLTINEKGLITRVNLTGADIFGVSRKDIINSALIQFIKPNFRDIYYKHSQEVLKSQVKQQCEIELLSRNKIPLFASLNTMAVYDKNGDFKEFRIVLTDITEHKKVEAAFAKKKDELQTIFDSSRSYIFYKDKENRFLRVNKAFAEILGWPKEKLEGVSLFDIFPKQQAEAYWKDDKEVMKSGKPKIDIIEPILYKDTIRYVQTDKIPYRDLDGNIIGIIGFADDITERKQSEEEILKAKEEWEHTFDAIPDLLAIVHRNYEILQVNQPMASRLGLELEDCIGRKCYELIHGSNEPPLNCPHTQMLEDGLEHTIELYEEKLQGNFISSASPIYKENKELTKCVHVLRDITKLKIIEEDLKSTMNDLKHSNKELEQFAYITSHDLREPLRMITSFLQLLERRYKDQIDEDANEFIGFAVEGAKRLDNMTNDLLKYSKITGEKREIKPVNFEHVLEKALTNLTVQIEENNAIITHDPLPTIMGDEELKVQLFQNLIGNAIKYRSQDTPRIHISAIKETNQYLFSIKDNGIGIDSEHLNRIFTIFQRLHARDEYEGTGIGLAITEKIVQQSGGQIWVESEPRKGSTFYFTIPFKAKSNF